MEKEKAKEEDAVVSRADDSTTRDVVKGKEKPKVKARARAKVNRLRVSPGPLLKAAQKAKASTAHGTKKGKESLRVSKALDHLPKNDHILSCMEPTLQAH
jgi:hypothetical protein